MVGGGKMKLELLTNLSIPSTNNTFNITYFNLNFTFKHFDMVVVRFRNIFLLKTLRNGRRSVVSCLTNLLVCSLCSQDNLLISPPRQARADLAPTKHKQSNCCLVSQAVSRSKIDVKTSPAE